MPTFPFSPGQCLLAKGPSETCGMLWVDTLGYLGGGWGRGVQILFHEAGNPKHKDPVFREEKGESVNALTKTK